MTDIDPTFDELPELIAQAVSYATDNVGCLVCMAENTGKGLRHDPICWVGRLARISLMIRLENWIKEAEQELEKGD